MTVMNKSIRSNNAIPPCNVKTNKILSFTSFVLTLNLTKDGKVNWTKLEFFISCDDASRLSLFH